MTPSDIRCQNCSTVMRPAAGARAVRCPGCGGAVVVPGAAPAPAPVPVARVARVAPPSPPAPVAQRATPARPVAARARDDDRFDDDREAKRSGERKKPRKSEDGEESALGGSDTKIVVYVVGGIAALFVVGIGVALGVSAVGKSARATPDTPAAQPVAAAGNAPDPYVPPAAPVAAPATPARAGDVVQRVKESTVYIRSDFGGGRIAMGTGFFAGKPGFVVTNAHVIGYDDAEYRKPIKIETMIASGETNQRTFTASIYGLDVDQDLAVLKVDAPDLPPPLPFGSAAALHETEEVLIFGYPLGEVLGLNVSVNKTTVSSLRKENGKIAVVQVAGGMHPGNSGGPVVNQSGQVIGVSVAVITGTVINFAIPSETASSFVQNQFSSGGSTALGKSRPAVDRPNRVVIGPRRVGPSGLGSTPPAMTPSPPPQPAAPPPPPSPNKLLGFPYGTGFEDPAPANSLLVGFDVYLGKFVNNDVVSGVRPVFRSGTTDTPTKVHGVGDSVPIKVRAKAGYAVGMLTAKSSVCVDGFSVTFMKVQPNGLLDETDRYESDWIGGQGGGGKATVGGNGTPPTGFAGRTAHNNGICSIGLMFPKKP